MTPTKIDNTTNVLYAPKDWDAEDNGECAALSVRVEDDRFSSAWMPSDEERAAINAGASIILTVFGGQPPVMLSVEETAEGLTRKRVKELETEVTRLRRALRGGNGLKDNADMLEWLAGRLVEVHGEKENLDYIVAAKQRARWLREATVEANRS